MYTAKVEEFTETLDIKFVIVYVELIMVLVESNVELMIELVGSVVELIVLKLIAVASGYCSKNYMIV